MGDWRVELFHNGSGNVPDHILNNGPQSIELVFVAEQYLRDHGVPGKAIGRVRYEGDTKVHHILHLEFSGDVRVENTPDARWPIYEAIPDDGLGFLVEDEEAETEIDGETDETDFGGDDVLRLDGENENDSDSGGEGDDDVLTRIFGRFFDGKRWRKAAVGDPEALRQVQRASFGVIVESEVEREGDEHKARARQEQARVAFMHNEDKKHVNRMVISIPFGEGVTVDTSAEGRITVLIPVDESL